MTHFPHLVNCRLFGWVGQQMGPIFILLASLPPKLNAGHWILCTAVEIYMRSVPALLTVLVAVTSSGESTVSPQVRLFRHAIAIRILCHNSEARTNLDIIESLVRKFLYYFFKKFSFCNFLSAVGILFCTLTNSFSRKKPFVKYNARNDKDNLRFIQNHI